MQYFKYTKVISLSFIENNDKVIMLEKEKIRENVILKCCRACLEWQKMNHKPNNVWKQLSVHNYKIY